MTLPVEFKHITPAEQLAGEDPSETRQLREMLHRAETYLRSFNWCPPIAERFLGYGVGGVITVFLFKLAGKVNGTDEFLWVVEGDVPSAYLVTDNAPDPGSALAVYCEMMEEWANAVLNGSPLNEVFPVGAPATRDNANKLLSRTRFIRERLIPISQRL
jgi:hypothetical protein